jgi:LysR family transcriptional regulator, mexEF-oprN operon transcriptional activator
VDLLRLPDLTARLRQVAPGIKLLSPSYHEDRLDALLDAGVLDMAVGCKYSPASRHPIEVLYDAEVMCCYNPALMLLADPVPLEAYQQADHAVISHSDSLKGCLEGALEFAGADLNVVAAAPDFMSVLMTARASPVIATVPARIARRYASMLGLAMSPVPIELKFPPVAMVWPRHAENDSAGLWLRDQIRDIFAAAPDDWRAMVQAAA